MVNVERRQPLHPVLTQALCLPPCLPACVLVQVERARKAARLDDSSEQPVDTELKRSEADEPIKLSLAASAAAAAAAAGAAADKQQSRGAAVAAPPLFGDDDGG